MINKLWLNAQYNKCCEHPPPPQKKRKKKTFQCDSVLLDKLIN